MLLEFPPANGCKLTMESLVKARQQVYDQGHFANLLNTFHIMGKAVLKAADTRAEDMENAIEANAVIIKSQRVV